MPYDLDIKAGVAKPGHLPQAGWHLIDPEHMRLAYVTLHGDAYQMQAFATGEVNEDNMEQLAERSRRIAWANFAELGLPGPSQPSPQKP